MTGTSQNILITGGLGYLGGRITSHLSTAYPEMSLRLMVRPGREQIPDWANALDLVRADLRDAASIGPVLDGIDTVIHLAAVDEIVSQRDPDLALEVNGRGTLRLLDACREHGTTRFIYFSTFHVYGPGVIQPITEECPTRPVHPYAITHRLAEDYVNWFKYSYGLETVILRLSNGYGYPMDPWVQRWTLVFNDLAMQAVKNGEIRLRSQGGQHRDFISLSDVARGVQHFLTLPSEEWGDGLFNFGGECSMSILEVAQRISSEYLKHSGKNANVILGESEDPSTVGPVSFSVEKMKQTGFELLGDMSQEIKNTLKLIEQLNGTSGP